MILLTEGRGGRFVSAGGERLHYLSSGREPHLLVGSRRGVPYHAKPMYRLQAAKPSAPTFCTTEAVTCLLERATPITFWSDLWPLIGREVTWAYYIELALGHPGRVRGSWSDFAATYAELPWGSTAYDRWISTVVPDPADRLDLLALDRPLGVGRLPIEPRSARCCATTSARISPVVPMSPSAPTSAPSTPC